MSDAEERAPWTVKGMRMQPRRQLTDYAMRHDMTVADAVAAAAHMLIERERGVEVIPPGSPAADRANPASWERWAAAHKAAKEAGMPRDFMVSLRQQAAGELHVTRQKPPARRIEPPPLLTERRQTWRENSKLVEA